MSENDLIYEPNLPLSAKSCVCYFTREAFESMKHGFELMQAFLKSTENPIKSKRIPVDSNTNPAG
jgi:hypothetical protein